MNYEQKYNELVNAVKILKETNPSDEGIQNWVNENVPELAESEDERIRNAIICYIGYGQHCGVSNIDMIAWLKKQGRVKESEISQHEGATSKGNGNSLTNEDKEQKPQRMISAEAKEALYDNVEDFEDELADILFINTNSSELPVERLMGLCHTIYKDVLEAARKEIEKNPTNSGKPAWGEEDEENLYLTIAAIEKKYSGELFLDKKKVEEQVGTGRKLLDWLYSFQDRVKPQPKQDWSEEDEVKINRIVGFIENLNIPDNDILRKDAAWLKSLKERVQPKQEWDKEDEKEWKSIVSVLTRMHFLDELEWLRSKLKR